jgi:transcriptional antiterminator
MLNKDMEECEREKRGVLPIKTCIRLIVSSIERNSLKERYIQGSLFLFEVCYVKSEKKRIINATWQKTGQGEVYSPEVRKGLKQLNIPSRIGYDKGYRTRVYSTSTIDDFDEDKYNQIKIVLEEVLDFFDKMSGRDLMSFINEQYLMENLTTGKKIRMPP